MFWYTRHIATTYIKYHMLGSLSYTSSLSFVGGLISCTQHNTHPPYPSSDNTMLTHGCRNLKPLLRNHVWNRIRKTCLDIILIGSRKGGTTGAMCSSSCNHFSSQQGSVNWSPTEYIHYKYNNNNIINFSTWVLALYAVTWPVPTRRGSIETETNWNRWGGWYRIWTDHFVALVSIRFIQFRHMNSVQHPTKSIMTGRLLGCIDVIHRSW